MLLLLAVWKWISQLVSWVWTVTREGCRAPETGLKDSKGDKFLSVSAGKSRQAADSRQQAACFLNTVPELINGPADCLSGLEVKSELCTH